MTDIVIDQRTVQRVPPDWVVAAMQAAGVGYIAEARAADGALIGFDIDPPLTQAEYEDAAAAGLKAELKAYAADRRWRKEIAGITVAGVPVATDDRSKLMITGARVAAMADPDWVTVWHGADGQTYPVDAVAMVVISDAVQAHVNQCFATFSIVNAAIVTGEITTKAEIDAAFAA